MQHNNIISTLFTLFLSRQIIKQRNKSMKKSKLSFMLLLISVGCIASVSITHAATKSKTVKTTNQNVAHSQPKKNKTVYTRKMTEKDIPECTRLINKATQLDNVSQKEMTVINTDISNNLKITEHLKKPADVQLFASDDPHAIAHLTGKIVEPVTPVIKQPTKTKKLTLSTPTEPPTAPPVTAVKTPKTLSKSTSQPHIQLFAPNTNKPANFDHLEGKSASLENVIPAPVKSVSKSKVATTSKTKKAIQTPKKSTSVTKNSSTTKKHS
jgi:hypothetical protein